MVQQLSKRVEDLISKMMEELDKTYLRKMQGDMHRCAASCCDNSTFNITKVHKCVDNCGTSLFKAQNYVQGEFERTQNRLQRCVMECNDKIKDKMGPNPTDSEVNRYSDDFENCATKCVNEFCDLLPTIERTMKNRLASKVFD